MKYTRFFMLLLVGVGVIFFSVSDLSAQGSAVDSGAEQTEIEQSIAAAKAELEDKEVLAQKIALAKRMHEIRPTREQIDSAVRRVSLSFPVSERQKFIDAMGSMLNYNAIERISIDSMVEIYTLAELEAMVEYFSKPEAISASNKMKSWAAAVQPEVVHMIDKAMMRIKTGQ